MTSRAVSTPDAVPNGVPASASVPANISPSDSVSASTRMTEYSRSRLTSGLPLVVIGCPAASYTTTSPVCRPWSSKRMVSAAVLTADDCTKVSPRSACDCRRSAATVSLPPARIVAPWPTRALTVGATIRSATPTPTWISPPPHDAALATPLTTCATAVTATSPPLAMRTPSPTRAVIVGVTSAAARTPCPLMPPPPATSELALARSLESANTSTRPAVTRVPSRTAAVVVLSFEASAMATATLMRPPAPRTVDAFAWASADVARTTNSPAVVNRLPVPPATASTVPSADAVEFVPPPPASRLIWTRLTPDVARRCAPSAVTPNAPARRSTPAPTWARVRVFSSAAARIAETPTRSPVPPAELAEARASVVAVTPTAPVARIVVVPAAWAAPGAVPM